MGVVVEKRVGETPLQALERYRAGARISADVPLTYAGRLDPMAEGKLLVLVGEECKRRSEYDALDKEYEFEILLGFKSDTGDVLGLAESCGGGREYPKERLKEIARSFVGTHTLPYPAFSSKTVGGKPLFQHALENNLDAIEIPTMDARIYRLRYTGKRVVPVAEMVDRIIGNIGLLKVDADDGRLGSDFRKGEICARWRELQSTVAAQCTVLKFKAVVSSGTYIRTLSSRIAEALGTCGLAYSIRRTKIGRYLSVTKRFGFWRHTLV